MTPQIACASAHPAPLGESDRLSWRPAKEGLDISPLTFYPCRFASSRQAIVKGGTGQHWQFPTPLERLSWDLQQMYRVTG